MLTGALRDRSTSGSSRTNRRGLLANAELFLQQTNQAPAAAADPDAMLTESREEEASSNDSSPDGDDSFVSASGTPGPRL